MSSIRVRLIALFILVTTVTLSAFGFYDQLFLSKELDARLLQLQEDVITRLQANLAEPVWALDQGVIVAKLEAALIPPEVSAVYLLDATGRGIKAGIARNTRGISHLSLQRDEARGVAVEADIYPPEKIDAARRKSRTGKIVVYFTRDRIDEALRVELSRHVVQVLTMDFLLLLMLILSLRMVFEPLRRLRDAMFSLASGDGEELKELAPTGLREFDDVIEGFNRILNKLKQVILRRSQAETDAREATAVTKEALRQLHATQVELTRKERYQRALLDNFPFAVWLKDTESRFLSVNSGFVRQVGANSPDDMVGKNDFDIAPRDMAEGYRADDRAVLESRKKKNVEEEILDRGTRKWFETYKAPVIDENGDLLGTVGFARDISERKAAEEEIRNLAFYDSLTRLPNRRLLLDRINQASLASARSHMTGALLYIDLDHFKTLNDTLGHDMGDLLLQQVARRLESCVRELDTVARIGGDEFVVMLEDLGEKVSEASAKAESIGAKILAVLNQPYQLGAHEFCSTPSIGATLFCDHHQTPEELLKQADFAMYQSKKAGRNAIRFFDPQIPESA